MIEEEDQKIPETAKQQGLENQDKSSENKVINISPDTSLNENKVTNTKNQENGKTVFHITEEYLNDNYQLRYNQISLEIEISYRDENKWKPINENSLWIEMKKEGINIPMNSFIAILKSSFVENFNPLKTYFEKLPKWDEEKDYISDFLNYIEIEDHKELEQFHVQFKKWIVRTVKCAIEKHYFNKQAFILSDNGNGQNIGKTSWCRYLCPTSLKNYFAEDISNDKDARILLCKNMFINLDELAALSKKEINHLKAYFSKEQINDRLPYDRKNTIIPRIASFIGSTNMSTFLQDETGSVRWVVFSVRKIDWNYKKHNFDINKLWSQAYFLAYSDEKFDETFSLDDIKENEKRNEKYTIMSNERELLNQFFKVPKSTTEQNIEFLTATETLIRLRYFSSLRLTDVGIGKAFKASGFERKKANGVYGYYVIQIKHDISTGFKNS